MSLRHWGLLYPHVRYFLQDREADGLISLVGCLESDDNSLACQCFGYRGVGIENKSL